MTTLFEAACGEPGTRHIVSEHPETEVQRGRDAPNQLKKPTRA